MEISVLKVLDYNLLAATSRHFVDHLLQLVKVEKRTMDLAHVRCCSVNQNQVV